MKLRRCLPCTIVSSQKHLRKICLLHIRIASAQGPAKQTLLILSVEGVSDIPGADESRVLHHHFSPPANRSGSSLICEMCSTAESRSIVDFGLEGGT